MGRTRWRPQPTQVTDLLARTEPVRVSPRQTVTGDQFDDVVQSGNPRDFQRGEGSTPQANDRGKPIPGADESAARSLGKTLAALVGVFYFAASLVIFRDVLVAIPAILRGDAVLVGDELVPFFNPDSQLISQAAGEFSDLTQGYEFRVRYSFLTTWMRHYQVLPFAVLLVLPATVYATYLSTARFINKVFTTLEPTTAYAATFFPVTLLYMIVIYAKITHFYTLIIGLAMFTTAVLNTFWALLFARRHWVRSMGFSAALVLLNPAVHYLLLYLLVLTITIVVIVIAEVLRWFRRPSRWRRGRGVRQRLRLIVNSRTGRCLSAGAIVTVVALVPYALFVKFVALRGVENLAETVPGDHQFISDASVSWLHLLSWDLAGITDKLLFGDYLAKVPRWRNIVYSAAVIGTLAGPARRRLFRSIPQRRLYWVLVTLVGFSFWATIGFAEPNWFPSFHRVLSSISLSADRSDSQLGDLLVSVTSSVVQVLRFPHRFQLILFALAPMLMSAGIAWAIDGLRTSLQARLSRLPRRPAARMRRRRGEPVAPALFATVLLGSVFFAPFWSNQNYREVYSSGDFGGFLAPYPLDDLRELRDALSHLEPGKAIVLPPSETSKRALDRDGNLHKLIDKFYIYYLDQPSYYYGLTGDSQNKFNFFLMLRGIYYQQDWWVNVARDLDVRYIIADRTLRDNNGVGAEYLPNAESLVEPALQFQSDKFALRFKNEAFTLYELLDRPEPNRPTLLINAGWQS